MHVPVMSSFYIFSLYLCLQWLSLSLKECECVLVRKRKRESEQRVEVPVRVREENNFKCTMINNQETEFSAVLSPG